MRKRFAVRWPDVQYIYYRLDTLFPRVIKHVLPESWRRGLDPFQDVNYPWPLTEPLSGYTLRAPKEALDRYVFRPQTGSPKPADEVQVLSMIQEVVKPGMVCLDIGAHVGYTALLLCKCCAPSGRVYAFEALPRNAETIRLNISDNGFAEQVVVENLAVSDNSGGWVRLYDGRSSFTHSMFERPGFTEETGIEVPTISLDDYFDVGSRVDFVKIDIEGAESLAISGMRRILQEQRPVCLVEIHGDAELVVIEQLQTAGYDVFDMDRNIVDRLLPEDSPFHVLATPSLQTT